VCTMISESLWRELFLSIDKKQWPLAINTFELILQKFFYPQKVPDIFKLLSEKEILPLIREFEIRKFKAEKTIIKEGERSDSLFIVVSGKVEVLAIVETKDKCTIPLPCVIVDKFVSNIVHGNEIVIAHLKEGDILGEMALISSQPRTATAKAETDVDLIEVKRSTMTKLFDKRPEIEKFLLDLYFLRVDAMIKKIKGIDKKGFVSDIISSLSTEKLTNAEISIDKLIAKDPSNPINYLKKGDILYKKGLNYQAVIYYKKAAQLMEEQECLCKALIVYKIVHNIEPHNEKINRYIKELVAKIESDTIDTPPEDNLRPFIATASEHALFSHLTDKEIKEVLAKAEVKHFSCGDVVITEGEHGDSVYIIKEGKAQVITEIFGEHVLLTTLIPGDIFGEAGFLTGRPRTASVVAHNTLTAIELQKPLIENLFQKHPEIMDYLDETHRLRVQDIVKRMDTIKESMIKGLGKAK
jgi:CRP-like cAMP-binding protein